MTVHAVAGFGLLLTGAAISQAISFGIAAWREERHERQIDDTLGPPAPDPSDNTQ